MESELRLSTESSACISASQNHKRRTGGNKKTLQTELLRTIMCRIKQPLSLRNEIITKTGNCPKYRYSM
jgi:hypothetical protein